jgi:hypothetical protein
MGTELHKQHVNKNCTLISILGYETTARVALYEFLPKQLAIVEMTAEHTAR